MLLQQAAGGLDGVEQLDEARRAVKLGVPPPKYTVSMYAGAMRPALSSMC